MRGKAGGQREQGKFKYLKIRCKWREEYMAREIDHAIK